MLGIGKGDQDQYCGLRELGETGKMIDELQPVGQARDVIIAAKLCQKLGTEARALPWGSVS